MTMLIPSRIQIGDGPVEDFFKKFGFIYMDADPRTEAPIKARTTTSYAEEAGEHVDPRTVPDAFDYTAKFLIEAPNRDFTNANAKIAAFNKALYSVERGSDIRRYKQITFYNDHQRVKIVGIPEPIAQPTDFYRRSNGSAMDCVQVELKIRVADPTKCDFNLNANTDGSDYVHITLSTDGKDIFLKTSRPLADNEYPLMLTRGSARVRSRKNDTEERPHSRFRWHTPRINPEMLRLFSLEPDGRLVWRPFDAKSAYSLLHRVEWHRRDLRKSGNAVVVGRKTFYSSITFPLEEGRRGSITFGVGIYKCDSLHSQRLISNVARAKSNVHVVRATDGMLTPDSWLSV